jgi:hypothetical protein
LLVKAALSQINRACEDEVINHNRNIEQAAYRLQEIERKLNADISGITETIARQRAGEG